MEALPAAPAPRASAALRAIPTQALRGAAELLVQPEQQAALVQQERADRGSATPGSPMPASPSQTSWWR
jgi:hypothetical protein